MSHHIMRLCINLLPTTLDCIKAQSWLPETYSTSNWFLPTAVHQSARQKFWQATSKLKVAADIVSSTKKPLYFT